MIEIGELDDCVQRNKRPWLETIAVMYYLFIFFWSILLSLAVCAYVLSHPSLWIIAVPYVVWLYFDWNSDERGAHLWRGCRSFWLWNYVASYFQARLVKTAELPATKNYIIASHPHGIVAFGTFLAFATEACKFSTLFPGLSVHGATLRPQFIFPIRREYLLINGIISSSKRGIGAILGRQTKGNAVVLVPGGAEEALVCDPYVCNVVLAKRKGFIRMALKYGADIVPCFNFGEQKLFRQWPNPEGSYLRRFQQFVKQLTGATPPAFWGRCVMGWLPFGWMPFRERITTVVGLPIGVEQSLSPTEREVDALHARYCEALQALFDEHKMRFDSDATEDTKLRII